MSNVMEFGAAGDGERDDFDAIMHAIQDGDGAVHFPRGTYRITRPLLIHQGAPSIGRIPRMALRGDGGTAKIIMDGAGPAIHFVGHHEGTADPKSMKPAVWLHERMPTVADIEIEGRHPEADGIQLEGNVQPVVRNVLLRELRHGIRLVKRNRNVIIEGCQIYHNTGVGIFMDGVNLHQINIIGNHVSYNRLGGIRIERSEVRNLQITGNDIEYNNDRSHGIKDEPTAEIYIDCTANNATVNEVTIASNTIQATPSAGGTNLRIIEDRKASGRPPGLYAITGNVIGSQTNNVHLSGCYGITLTGNSIYSAMEHNLLLDDHCRQIIVANNQFRRHTPDKGTGIRLVNSTDCIVTGCHVLDEAEGGQASGNPLLALDTCQRITVTGTQLIGNGTTCLSANGCKDVVVGSCTLLAGVDQPAGRTISFTGKGFGNMIHNCRLRRGLEETRIEEQAGVKLEGNLTSD